MATYARGKKWADAGSDIQKVWNADIQLEDRKFQLVADFEMTGDQPAAVARLVEGVENGCTRQTMPAVT
ncbi:MAG: hypothetical protein FI715_02940, partial [SAR202 cluster bacterium]|nr:hypothetical protein [SAR202 cluster bacterium]